MDAQARSNLYGFFSRLFARELDESAVELVRGPLGRELLPAFSAGPEVDVVADPERRVAVHDADYVHLTVVDVVPYGSFYAREDGMVASGTANPVAEFLREYGFDVDLEPARSLSPDHVGIVLEAMAQLCAAEAEAEARPDPDYAETIRGVEQRFLETHVLRWVPIFLFAVERVARSQLYRELAQVTMSFLGSDHEGLCEGRE